MVYLRGHPHNVRTLGGREGGFDEKRMVSYGEGGRIITLCVRLFSHAFLYSPSLESSRYYNQYQIKTLI